MKKGKTEVVLIIDRSGSMHSIRNDMEGGLREYSWDFMFLGANIDAVSVGSTFGISRSSVLQFKANSNGTQVMSQAMSDYTSSIRSGVSYSVPEDMRARAMADKT